MGFVVLKSHAFSILVCLMREELNRYTYFLHYSCFDVESLDLDLRSLFSFYIKWFSDCAIVNPYGLFLVHVRDYAHRREFAI